MKRTELGKHKKDTSEGIELNPVNDLSTSRILTKEAAFSRPFHIQNLTAPNMKHIHVKGYVDFYGGYAEHTRQVLTRLHDNGNYSIKLTPIRTPIDVDPFVWGRMNTFIYNNSFNMQNSTFLCIAGPGHFQADMLPKDRKVIGWSMLETLELPNDVQDWLSNCDELWCPTDQDIRRCRNVNVKLEKVHLGFDEEVYNPQVQALDIAELRGRFVFGVFGSWNKRKGIKEIIQAYCRQFTGIDDVSLFLFCKYGTRPHKDPIYGREKEDEGVWNIDWELDKYLEEIGMDREHAPHITLLDIPIHENVLPHILRRVNCLVGFSRGESTWLPGLEAMAMNIPVIQLASKCSGYMEYMNDRNTYLCHNVKYEDAIEEDYLGTSEYYEGGKFATGDIEELMFNMQRVIDDMLAHKSQYKKKIELALDTVQNWTWNKSMTKVNELLLND